MSAGAVSVPTIVPLRAPIPGQHKTCIDTRTKIELRSETGGASIFYTTNGKNPAPFQKHGLEAKSTMKYREPFRLLGGKRTVKALAVAPDGLRESFVVTKTFDVEQLEDNDLERGDDGTLFIDDIPAQEMAKQDVKKYAHKMMTSKDAWAEVERRKDEENLMRDLNLGSSNRMKPGAGTRYMNNRNSARATAGQPSVGAPFQSQNPWDGVDGERSKWQHPDTATQTLRLQRETDFLKCVYCFAPRPADPYSRFCNDCGNPVPPLPQARMPPPEPGQMGTCVQCNSLVPFNTAVCLICEAPIPQQNVPQAHIRLADKTVCISCGTANPANISTCVTCEARLPAAPTKPLYPGESAPPVPRGNDRWNTCTKCGRVNNPDARFCDWCGTKPNPPAAALVCSKCGGQNNPYGKFCASCGVVLEAPQRPELRGTGLNVNIDPTNARKTQGQWLPISIPLNVTPKCDMSTQTAGLFFPSTKEISKRTEDEEDRMAMEKQARDRKPLVTAISPGRGYWRKQMEHVCTHLKAHAQNNPEFRALIGEPRMGKIVSTAVHEDKYELSITTNFALRGTKDPFVGDRSSSLNKREFLSSNLRKASMSSYGGSQESLVTPGRSTSRSKSGKRGKTTKKIKRKPKDAEHSLSEEDKRLLKEVGKLGEGEADEVQQLLEEGADANCVNKDGMPVLLVAVQNKKVDAIPVLVQEGAEVNIKGPNRGNTALHEAVMMGNQGKPVIDVLLGCGANPQVKNDKGDTSYDLALKEGYESIANKFTASMGQTSLDKLLKPKHSSSAHIFE